MHARIVNGAIVEVRTITREPGYDGVRWWNLRDPGEFQLYLETHNWVEVVETPKPPDTATHTYHTYTVELVNGVPTQVWQSRPWTAEELDSLQEATNEQKLLDDAKADLLKVTEVINDTKLLLGDNTVPGSIRSWRGTVTNQYNATVLRNLGDLLIQLTQDVRKISRQVQRLGKLQVRDLDSADVGEAQSPKYLIFQLLR